MGRCKYEKLENIEPALNEIRKLVSLKETKPGIFYLKSQAFLHFHERDEKIWADVRDGKFWGTPIDVPAIVTTQFLTEFVTEVTGRYKRSGGEV